VQLSAGFHQHKLAQVREELGNQGLDGLLVMNPVNVYYLTGFWHTPAGVMERPAFVLVPQTGEPTLMVSLDVYGHRGADLSPVVDDIRAYSEYPFTGGQSTLDWACREIEGAGLEGMILGVEDNFTPLNDGLCQP
jgi:Xaa-Pro aminopeptidase